MHAFACVVLHTLLWYVSRDSSMFSSAPHQLRIQACMRSSIPLALLQAPGCPIAMHKECAGLDKVPRGKWFCPEHASLQPKARPRPASAMSSGSLDADNGAKPKAKSGSKAGKPQSADTLPGKTGPDADPKVDRHSKAGKARADAALDDGSSNSELQGGAPGKARSTEESAAGPSKKASNSKSKQAASKAGTAQAAGKAKSKQANSRADAGHTEDKPKAKQAPSKAGKAPVGDKANAKKGGSKAGPTRAYAEEDPGASQPAKKRRTSGEEPADAETAAEPSQKTTGSKGKEGVKKQQSALAKDLPTGNLHGW